MKHQEHDGKKHRIGTVFHSLRFQMISIMLLCYLIPALLLGLFTQNVLNSMRRKTEAALETAVEHAWTLTISKVERAIALARDAIYDGELADAFDRWHAGEIADAEYLRLSRAYMDRKYSREELFTFAAYFPVDRPEMYMYTRSGYQGAMAFLADMQSRVLTLGESLDTGSQFVESSGNIYLIRNLMNLKMERYGMLVLGIDRVEMFSALMALGDAWQGTVLFRLDDAGETGSSWEESKPGMSEEGTRIRYFQCSSADEYRLDFSLTLDKKQQYREYYLFRCLMQVLQLLIIPLVLLLGWYLHKRIIHPIALLSSASKRIENGELGVTVPLKGEDELCQLGAAFSKMSQRIEELIDKTYKEEIALKDAQIQALQSRINPHFINNALEAINWEARMEKSETIPVMVSALSVLLGASMARQDRRLVTLKEEMEIADAYIYFVQQRFDDSLSFTRQLEEASLKCQLPLLTVQPVLENAVEHGIAPAGGGEISLSCTLAGSCARIEVINSGRPIASEDREKIDAALRGETSGGTHLGLANIADRLRLIYGGAAQIHVFSDTENRTVVRIDVPQSGSWRERE